METTIPQIWSYLSGTPLFWLLITLGTYHLATVLYHRLHAPPLLHPLVLAISVLVGFLLLTGTPYDVYFKGAQFIHFMLGPATVALAVPLYLHVTQVRRVLLPLGAALLIGSVVGIVSAVWIAKYLGASELTLLSFAPKSVTTPIAMGISEKIGGAPALTTVLVVLTGIVGAVCAGPLLALLRIRRDDARGFAIGLSSHGIGTAIAFQMSEEAGAFSGLAMGLNGVVTAVLVPLLIHWLI